MAKTKEVKEIILEEPIGVVKVDTEKHSKGTFDEKLDDTFSRLDAAILSLYAAKREEYLKGYITGVCVGGTGMLLGLYIGSQITKKLEESGG